MFRPIIAVLMLVAASQIMANDAEVIQIEMALSRDGHDVATPVLGSRIGEMASIEFSGEFRIEVTVSGSRNGLYDAQLVYSNLGARESQSEPLGFDTATFHGIALGDGGRLSFPGEDGAYLLSFNVVPPNPDLFAGSLPTPPSPQ